MTKQTFIEQFKYTIRTRIDCFPTSAWLSDKKDRAWNTWNKKCKVPFYRLNLEKCFDAQE